MRFHLLPALVGLTFALPLTASAQLKIPARVAAPVEAPFSLTAADGTGLELTGLDARAVVDGPLAFTEVRLTFQNPQSRVIEGHFKVTMPDGAAISRFAMKINGRWMEGEVVEKQQARRAYEDALHRRQDPALLEQDAGNQFRARVFPIPARGTKELIVSWSQTLTAPGEAYRLPLAGLPRLGHLTLSALVAGDQGPGLKTSLGGEGSRYQLTRVEKQNFSPEEDWVVFAGQPIEAGEALRQGNLAVARFTVGGKEAGDEIIPFAQVLFDTSASRAIGYTDRLAALEQLVKGLADVGVEQVRVIAFDQNHETIYQGAPGGFGAGALKALEARRALGASDLSAALSALPGTYEGEAQRIILVGDGVFTAGPRDIEAQRKAVTELAGLGVKRLDVVVDTTARDPLVLDALVTAGLPSAGRVVEGREPLADQLSRLRRRTLPEVTLTVPGAEWIWPAKLGGLQPGDPVVVFADLPEARPMKVQLSGGVAAEINPTARGAERPLLERAWVKARIERLEAMRTGGDPDMRAALVHQITNLSIKHRVLSPYTALVVLENEHEYRRFGIDRRALADILTVGPGGVALLNRRDAPMVAKPVQPTRTRTGANRAKADARPNEAVDDLLANADANKDFAEAEEAEKVAEARPMGGGGAEPSVVAEQPSAEPPPSPLPAPEAAAAAPRVESKRRAPARRPARDQRMELALEEDNDEIADGFAAGVGDAGGERRADRAGGRRTASIARERAMPDPFPGRGGARNNRPRRPVAKRPSAPRGLQEFRQIERGKPALTGRMAEVDTLIEKNKGKVAMKKADAWRTESPAELLALVALGKAALARGDQVLAARAFGSILDFYPSRADMRRFAGNWLELTGPLGLLLAADTYAVASEQRPDHPSVYHQLALVLVRLGRYEDALETALKGINARRVGNRFEAVERILMEDAQIIAAAWIAAEPKQAEAIKQRLASRNLRPDETPTMRFVLTWETDANDVDFHIFDKDYGHAFYSRRDLGSGGQLYADITTGYGPECFTVVKPNAFPYRLKAHYYRRGPLGYGMGKVQVIRHDGKGKIGVEDRPFVIMNDGAYVDLGTIKGKTARPLAIAR